MLEISSIKDVEKLKTNTVIKFKCIKCGKYQTNNVGRLLQKGALLCGNCQKAKTNLAKFGHECVFNIPGVRESALKTISDNKEYIQRKREESCLKTMGAKNPMQSEIGRKHYTDSNKLNHGGILHQQTEEKRKVQSEKMLAHPEWQIKSVKTNLKNHGGVHSLSLPENRQKWLKVVTDPIKKKEIQRTREETTFKTKGKKQWMTFGSEENLQNTINKILKEYTDISVSKEYIKNIKSVSDLRKILLKSEKFNDKCKKTLSNTLGTHYTDDELRNITFSDLVKLYRSEHPEIYDKIKETNLNRYGRTSYVGSCAWKKHMIDKYGTLSTNRIYNYCGITFQSMVELAVWIYCIDHNIPIIREPCIFQYNYDNKTHSYIPDFWIQGIGLVEIKGDQFFKDDGAMYFPYNRRHHNSIEFTKEEKEYYDNLYETKHQCGLQNGIVFWKSSECKLYLNYIRDKYGKDYLNKFKIDNPYNPSYFGINGYYQIQKPYNNIPIYYTSPISKGISPYDIDNNSEYTIIK